MAEVEAVAKNLLELDEDDLMVQIGVRAQEIETTPRAASIEALEEDIPVPRGAFNDLLKAGNNIFGPASEQAYKVLCSPIGGDSQLTAELDKLMTEKTTEAAAKMTGLLTPVLVGTLGLPQSLAVLVGSLIVKKLAKGTSDLICVNWKTNLDATSASPKPPAPETPAPETPAG
ncbi:MAG TPA: hypothetical protein V6C57_03220 [Coleofasciculaceae cyanobacterium]